LKDLKTRTICGILFVVILTGAIIISPYSFALLFLILSVFILKEFYSLAVQAGYSPQIWAGLLTGGTIFILSFLLVNHLIPVKYIYAFLIILFFFPVYELFRKKETPLVNIAITGFGVLYVSVQLSILNFIVFPGNYGNPVYDYSFLICILIFIWSSDSGAYMFGVKFGRNRLFERISPKKSWEGLIGGLFTSIVAAWMLSNFFTQHNFLFLITIAIIAVIAGTLGDLVESMIKRSVGVKDSGQFMPGHGGLLDRFDSLLLASPMIFFVLQFLP